MITNPGETFVRQNCDCPLCVRGRKLRTIIGKLDKEDGEFLKAMHDSLINTEEELEMHKHELSQVKRG